MNERSQEHDLSRLTYANDIILSGVNPESELKKMLKKLQSDRAPTVLKMSAAKLK